MPRKKKRHRYQWTHNGVKLSKEFPNKMLKAKFVAKLRANPSERSIDLQITFEKFAERYIEDYAKIELAGGHWETELRTLKKHLFPVLGRKKLVDIERRDFYALKGTINSGRLKAKTVNAYCSLATKILNIAIEWGYIAVNPFAGCKKLKVGNQTFGYWTPEERDKFLRFCKHHDPLFYKAVVVACHTGMRKGELRSLTRGAIDFRNKQVGIIASFNDRVFKDVDHTKNRDIRYCPMNPLVMEVLSEFKLASSDTKIFEGANLKNACLKLKEIAKIAGVKQITFHDTRHTFGACLAMADVPIRTIQELLGHKTISMTIRYTHLSPSHLAKATDVLCTTYSGTLVTKKSPIPTIGHSNCL